MIITFASDASYDASYAEVVNAMRGCLVDVIGRRVDGSSMVLAQAAVIVAADAEVVTFVPMTTEEDLDTRFTYGWDVIDELRYV